MIVRCPEEKYSTAPEGSFPAVCVDIVDLGLVPNRFEPEKPPSHQVRIIWQLDENDPGGRPFLIRRDMTASLHEKASLRKILESWRGRAFTPTELFGFDMETVIGTGCLLSVVHHQGSKGGTFANLGTVMKLPKGMKSPEIRDYVRVKDRQPDQAKPEAAPANEWGIDDSDVPFNRRPPLARASKENNENLLQVRNPKTPGGLLRSSADGRWSSREMQGMYEVRCGRARDSEAAGNHCIRKAA